MSLNSIFTEERVFVIAEIGSNHNQNLDCALEMIDAAAECGAQAVKFQSILPDKLICQGQLTADDTRLFERIQLQEEWYRTLYMRAKDNGLFFFSAPTYLEAVDKLVQSGARLMKIASPQAYGFPQVIEAVAKTGLPTLLSTGYCMLPEIRRAVECFGRCGDLNNLLLLHCISNYPTHPKDANLRYMDVLKQTFHLPVGLSDHTLGWSVAVAAAARGACVIEKHFTLSREQEGPDHFFALETAEFKDMVDRIREVEETLGDGRKDGLTAFEESFRRELMEYPFARRVIDAGTGVKPEDVYFRRTKTGGSISAWECGDKLFGHRARRPIEQDTQITRELLED